MLDIKFRPPIFHKRRRELRNIQRLKHSNCPFHSLRKLVHRNHSPLNNNQKNIRGELLHIG